MLDDYLTRKSNMKPLLFCCHFCSSCDEDISEESVDEAEEDYSDNFEQVSYQFWIVTLDPYRQ